MPGHLKKKTKKKNRSLTEMQVNIKKNRNVLRVFEY